MLYALQPQTEDPARTDAATAPEVAASHVPDDVPHYKSFDHITDPRVRRAKEYEVFLQHALSRFRDDAELVPRIMAEIEWAHAQGRRSKSSDRDLVFNAIEREVLTRREIAEDTGLPAATVYAHLKELVVLDLVQQTRRPVIGNNKFILVYSQTRRPLPL